MGVEDQDFEVHKLVTFPSLCSVSCCGQIALKVGTCGWDRTKWLPKVLLTVWFPASLSGCEDTLGGLSCPLSLVGDLDEGLARGFLGMSYGYYMMGCWKGLNPSGCPFCLVEFNTCLLSLQLEAVEYILMVKWKPSLLFYIAKVITYSLRKRKQRLPRRSLTANFLLNICLIREREHFSQSSVQGGDLRGVHDQKEGVGLSYSGGVVLGVILLCRYERPERRVLQFLQCFPSRSLETYLLRMNKNTIKGIAGMNSNITLNWNKGSVSWKTKTDQQTHFN